MTMNIGRGLSIMLEAGDINLIFFFFFFLRTMDFPMAALG